VGAQIIAAYRSTVAAVARTGLSVIVDDVLFEEDDWLSWRQHLAGLDVVWVGLKVPLDVLEQRERERGDRVAGQARSQHALVHRHATYDVEVDTASLTPGAAAILDAIGC
jgi:chloramphenicol 3-O phosphotransferase